MTRVLLILSSLSPLIGIIAIRMVEASPIWAVSLGSVALLAAVSLPIAIFGRRAVADTPFTLVSIRDDSAQVPAYLLTYVFPFAFATADDTASFWAYGVFAALLLVLLARTELSLVNPILLAFGFHTYEVRTTGNRTISLISKTQPLPHSTFLAYQVAGSAFSFRRLVDGDMQ